MRVQRLFGAVLPILSATAANALQAATRASKSDEPVIRKYYGQSKPGTEPKAPNAKGEVARFV